MSEKAGPESDGSTVEHVEEVSAGKSQTPEALETRAFFFAPPQWIISDMVPALIRAEIVACIVMKPENIKRVALQFPGSILYIYADHTQSADRSDWRQILSGLSGVFAKSGNTIVFIDRGLTQERRDELKMEGAPIAFIDLNQAFRTVQSLIFSLAARIGQKTRRKFIRVNCEGVPAQPEFNIVAGTNTFRGKIRDISASGMACYFTEPVTFTFTENHEYSAIQIQLRGSPILVRAVLAAIRGSEDARVLVFLFRWQDDARSMEKIHHYIASRMQEDLDKFLS